MAHRALQIDVWLNFCAYIQDGWLKSSERIFRREDFMAGKMLERGSELPVERQRLEDVTARYSFEKLSGGRERGKNTPNHITAKMFMVTGETILLRPPRAASKRLFSDLLILCGYERDADW